MEGSDATVLSISELLRQSRPFSATSSLRSAPRRRRRFSPPPPESSRSEESSAPDSSPRVLTPLDHAAMLVGTVTVPVGDGDGHPSAALKCSSNGTCFQFSDGASRICCDVVDFSAHLLGKRIRVVAFNFIPFKHGGGFLEIIRWSFAQSQGGLRPCSSSSALPLGSGSSSEHCSKARYCVRGMVESVSPVSVVPCSSGTNFDSGSARNLCGFLARLMICGCKLCRSRDVTKVLMENSNGSSGSHVYSVPEFVYFCGPASFWHPAITKLIGDVVVLSGLSKKLVYIGKDESQVMFMTTEKSLLHLLETSSKMLAHERTSNEKTGDCSIYTGLVTGIYMQGMVVELDKKVWLLLTDQQFHPPHSLRVGAVISVKNAHILNGKYSWAEMLILGGCFRTSILVESSSPFETSCYNFSDMQSMLGKFIATLSYPARLWVLLTISCFRKKFSGIFLEKEILGSKNKEGLLQMYASSHLPSWAFRKRHGVFMEMCRHDLCGFGCELGCRKLKLIVPFSLLVRHCESIWEGLLVESEKACKVSDDDKKSSNLYGVRGSYSQLIKRIIPSDNIGVTLLGKLKVSPFTGRLQLVDATRSLDVVIPDLPSTWNSNSIYEVHDYSVIMMGVSQRTGQLKPFDQESFSCRSIFNYMPLVREMGLGISICFHLKDANCIDFHETFEDEREELGSGSYHILRIVHKFPLLQKLSADPVISESIFVEAIILPWYLFLADKDGVECLPYALMDQLEEAVGRNSNKWADGSSKRHKTDITLSNDNRRFHDLNYHKVPCQVTVRGLKSGFPARSGSLGRIKDNHRNGISYKVSPHKVWLEFKPSDVSKYQTLDIGGYYIVKHGKEEKLCHLEDSARGMKIHFPSETKLWSLSFSSRDTLLHNLPHDSPLCTDQVLLGEETGNFTKAFSGCSLETFPDICLDVSTKAAGPFRMDLLEMEQSLTNQTVNTEDITVSSCSGNMISSLSSKFPSRGHLFPDGDLVSISGDVIAIQRFESTSCNLYPSHENLLTSNQQSRDFIGDTNSIRVHVLMDNGTQVQIFGSLRNHAYPIGFGPGVNATFCRILKLGGQEGFLLTPISFIKTNSLRMIDEQCGTKDTSMQSVSDRRVAFNGASSGFISELTQDPGCTMMQLRCKVIAVHILILEKTSIEMDCLQSGFSHQSSLVNIPIAGFVVEDGSSLCFCWASADRASTLLRLNEKLPQTALESANWTLKWVGKEKNASRTSAYYVDRFLKKHVKITVRNCGSMLDSSRQDLMISVGSHNVLSNFEEDILKYILFNASFATDWNIVGTAMDLNAARQLEKQHFLEMEMELDSIQHMWAVEVSHVNPLTEAKRTIEELLPSCRCND
ncbi:CST complex subunit CTC1 isoform X1 [Eucalyptus grandis]|uniref:CST complex subunit CTC1 isoform X1 n=1 Tax=Eucalyptus grandis TaxID=71139 RepID=UPI000524DB23|nr:CST complex subunit CTC1 isoform X1 [Eucalyptus grandis]